MDTKGPEIQQHSPDIIHGHTRIETMYKQCNTKIGPRYTLYTATHRRKAHTFLTNCAKVSSNNQ